MAFENFKVLTFDIVGTCIDFEKVFWTVSVPQAEGCEDAD